MNSNTKYCIVISGPTATGKTEVAIAIAKHFHTEIISADARQFYREMHIGTAKPNARQLQEVKHHYIDHISIDTPWDAGTFAEEGLKLLTTLFQKHDVVVLVGGSGLFIKALTEGFDSMPDVSVDIRNKVRSWFVEKGIGFLQEQLKEKDPDYYATVDLHNPHRIMRALEVCEQTGKTYSSFRKNMPTERPFTTIYIQLDTSREKLYATIHKRVDAMIANGLVEEARTLLPHRNKTALQTVGYVELFDHFDGKYDLPTAIEKIKQHTRNYAKRQITWYKKSGYASFAPTDIQGMLSYIASSME